MNIKEKILKLKKERNAVILAHHYAPVEVHEVADVLSDSRGFFEAVKMGFTASVVVVVAPTFFAELTAALLPDKVVLVPIIIECPVAMHRDLSFEKISTFKALHPGIPLVCYATSPFQTKLLADIMALPGEVDKAVQAIDADEVIFVGEKNCGEEAAKSSGKKVILYPNNPICNVYNSADISDVIKQKERYPNACLMVHPECRPEVCKAADYVIGTGVMYDIIKADTTSKPYILGTEIGFYLRMQKEFPEKKFIHLSPYLQCNVFKPFRIETIYDALNTMKEVIKPDRTIAKSVVPLFSNIFNIKPKAENSPSVNEENLLLLKESCEKGVLSTVISTTSGLAYQARFTKITKDNFLVLTLYDHQEGDLKPLSRCCVNYSRGSRTNFFISTVKYYNTEGSSNNIQLILNCPNEIFCSETRQSRRILILNKEEFQVQVTIPSYHMTKNAHAVDISYGGIQIGFSPDDTPDLPDDIRLLVEIQFRGTIVKLNAEVRHRHENCYGLLFLDTENEDDLNSSESLKAIINQLQNNL